MLIGLGLMIGAIILAFGFWFFNQGMFSQIIFSDGLNRSKVESRGQVMGDMFENNPLRLEVKVKGAERAVEIHHLPENKEVERVVVESKVLNIPFSSQAPLGEWDDPIFQDGCEEAAVMMAIYWVRGEELTVSEAQAELITLAEWQTKEYGEFRDSSVNDTAKRLMGEYYGYDKFKVKHDIAVDDIIFELGRGKAVIVPTNGRLLANPYYTPPGPERHNLIILGYDESLEEFIVNDPGTKRGERYRYNRNVVYDAIRDYPSGHHLPILGVEKNMIVVEK